MLPTAVFLIHFQADEHTKLLLNPNSDLFIFYSTLIMKCRWSPKTLIPSLHLIFPSEKNASKRRMHLIASVVPEQKVSSVYFITRDVNSGRKPRKHTTRNFTQGWQFVSRQAVWKGVYL